MGGLDPHVAALTDFDDGSGPALYPGALSPRAPAGDSYLSKWGGCSPWTDLGSGLPGISGMPQLTGFGELLADSPGSIRLELAALSALVLLFVSTSSTPTPFKGGTLLTVPVLLTLPLATDSLADLLLPWTAWPSGVSLFLQFAIQDSVAVKGAALSNALGADVPGAAAQASRLVAESQAMPLRGDGWSPAAVWFDQESNGEQVDPRSLLGPSALRDQLGEHVPRMGFAVPEPGQVRRPTSASGL